MDPVRNPIDFLQGKILKNTMKNKISNGINIDDKEIKKLADLARIKLSDEEKEEFKIDIESILGYVSEIREISSDISAKKDCPFLQKRTVLFNVMREDGEPHESGLYTEKILDEAPDRDGEYFKVKKIL